jgi:hypothetical protein
MRDRMRTLPDAGGFRVPGRSLASTDRALAPYSAGVHEMRGTGGDAHELRVSPTARSRTRCVRLERRAEPAGSIGGLEDLGREPQEVMLRHDPDEHAVVIDDR